MALTLKSIQARFAQNNAARQRHKQRVKNAIDLSFARHPLQKIESLQQSLIRERIQLILRQNDKGIIYGLTYIDHQTKCVFNGSDLGKQYSSHAIQQRCSGQIMPIDQQKQSLQVHQQAANSSNVTPFSTRPVSDILQALTEQETEPLAYELKQDQKRKRKKPKLN
jgi:hypothetical protein